VAQPKLSANQVRRIEEIQSFLKTVAHLKKMVGELESNRAARAQIVQNLSSQIAREFTHMRQRALTSNIGTIGDVAGALSIVAGRSAGLQMKIRALNDGVANLNMQLDQALKTAMKPEEEEKGGPAGKKPSA
jgi:hypothetical protein